MIKVTVEYLVDEKELEKELEIIRRAYTEALKNKKMTDVEIIQNTLLTGAKYDIKAKITRQANLAINTLLNYSIISNEEAEEMRMRNARKLCEEASTKLLLPMIMLLLVVMILIMFPAFSNVGV